jgi:peroxiredoxin
VYLDQKQDGVRFVGLNTRDQQAAALAFEQRFGITYPSLVDESGELQLAFRDSLPPNAIPSTLVIDRDGDIAARVVGPTTYSQLSELVGDVAAES